MAKDIVIIGNTTSPFVRKVMSFAIAAGLGGRVALRLHDGAVTFAENPLGKMPTMVLPDGAAVIESEMIIAELDALHGGPSLLPKDRAARRRRAIASGALDCAVARLYEGRRPADRQWPDWAARQKTKMDAALDALEAEAAALSPTALDAETTTIGVMLGYLDFRFAADEWRGARPGLARWFEAFALTPPMAETRPADPKPG